MNPELSNYFKRCLSPVFLRFAIGSLGARSLASLLLRAWPESRQQQQPQKVMKLRLQLRTEDPVPGASVAPGVLERRTLALAAGRLEFDAESTWNQEFADVEVSVSLHRWNWLLRSLTDDAKPLTADEGLQLMRSWIQECRELKGPGREPYSTGERIVNGSLFLLLTQREFPPDIAASFRQMARDVAANLEYHPGERTGNHAFNNARALLFAGTAANLPDAVELAYAIAEERLPQLVTGDGFLREGSSHYHFLFTRWVLEMLWLAERESLQDFAALLRRYAGRVVERCWFFLVYDRAKKTWQIPLMGDVSPDFPPDWLISLPWSALACGEYRPAAIPPPPTQHGWADLFGREQGASPAPKAQAASFASSGWSRADHGPWTLFVHAQSRDGVLRAGHEHHDLGGFVLFREGQPVLVDPGRLDYRPTPEGSYGKSALAHNTLLFDDLGPTADGPTWLCQRYSAVEARVRMEQQNDGIEIVLDHNGFTRLAKSRILHSRRYRLSRERFTLEDVIDGAGTHRVQARFHFAPGVELRPDGANTWRLTNPSMTFEPAGLSQASLLRGTAHPPFGGWFFPAYGEKAAAITLEMSDSVSLPATLKFTLFEAG